MAQIDVTDVLSDPDFLDPIQIIHRTPTIDTYGENVLALKTVNTVGSVQPISGKDLLRLPEDLRIKNIRSFWVRGCIISDGKNKYPDLLVYHCENYAVQHLDDWSSWGAGWTQGICIKEVPAQ